MKSKDEILERKNRLISQLKKVVSIFKKLKVLEKNKAANKDAICELIMEYDGIMKDPENVYNYYGKSPKHEKAREEIYREYKEGKGIIVFSYYVSCQIERFRVAIKELNFVLGIISPSTE